MTLLAFGKLPWPARGFRLPAIQSIQQTLRMMKTLRILKIPRILFLVFILACSLPVLAQPGFKVTGKITQASGEPLAGATINEKGRSTSTSTDNEGNYSLTVSNQNATLVVSYVGYATREIKLNGQALLNLSLQPSNDNLNEVVVIGYGTTRRKDLTGAVSSVSGKQLAAVPVANAAQALAGKLPV
jgi:hypothetical protein